MKSLSSIKLTTMVTATAGVWLILSPFIFSYTNMSLFSWTSVIIGVATCLGAGYQALIKNHNWMQTAILILGLWMIVAPFVEGATSSGAAVWSSVVTGIIVAFFSSASMAGGEEVALRRRSRRTYR